MYVVPLSDTVSEPAKYHSDHARAIQFSLHTSKTKPYNHVL